MQQISFAARFHFENEQLQQTFRAKRGARRRANKVYNLVTRVGHEPHVVLVSCKIGCPIFLFFFEYIVWCLPMTLCSVASWNILCFQAEPQTLPPMTTEQFHVAFMKGECVYSSSVKQCFRYVNHEQFPTQMTCTKQQAQHVLEIFAGEDFPPKLLWRTQTKIHRGGTRRRQQETAKQSIAQHSEGSIVNTATTNMYML